jgi:hypothetical protein
MAFIRTKRVGEHEYFQLVENYREDGHHRQRVLAHLGQHDTVEAALEAAREKLIGVGVDRDMKAEREARLWEQTIRRIYGDRLDHYHGGEIPSNEEVARRTGTDKEAPFTDEVTGTFRGLTFYKRAEVPIPPEVDEYCRAFGSEPTPSDMPNIYGHTLYYGRELFHYQERVRRYWYWRDRADREQEADERRRRRLREQIAKLEAVVTKSPTAISAATSFRHHAPYSPTS